jgi:hypothetical protein
MAIQNQRCGGGGRHVGELTNDAHRQQLGHDPALLDERLELLSRAVTPTGTDGVELNAHDPAEHAKSASASAGNEPISARTHSG